MLNKRNIIPIAISCSMLLSMEVSAQRKKAEAPKVDTAKAKVADTTRKGPMAPVTIKPYKEVITNGTKTMHGFFTVHQKDDKYYFELPNILLNKEILIVSRVSRPAAEMRNNTYGYAGDQIGETVYTFEMGPNKKVFMRRMFYAETAGDSSKTMYASVKKNNVNAIVMAFPIQAYRPDSSGVVVDVTELLNSDNDIIWFQKKIWKDKAGMAAQMNDRSYISDVKVFPSNIEIKAVKTYGAGMNPTATSYTTELNASIRLLPEHPMQPRYLDPRVGYFAVGFRDFDADPNGVANTIYATRWRLEPKPEDVEKYKRGELVEPAKPIVFYIDPVTPKKWIPYLIQGVNDWQKAFEKAGFKNAIYAREAPSKEEDSTWSIDDARHAAIIYRPSIVPNAMGPHVADPRTGEILESHIFWYHNVMQLLASWYTVQCGAVDPRVRTPYLSDTLMGELIRFVSSHEVGHTLGLRHNFGSSSTVPVENLRNKAWVEKYGHTPSIMDYARFNYVAQPEDKIGPSGLYPRINDYDLWAIEWGYRWRPEYKNAEDEKKGLVKIVSDSLKNHRLWFGSEMEPFDARCMNEDLSDDAVKASEYGIRNLKRILPNVIQWKSVPYEDYDRPMEFVKAVFQQFGTYLGHVTRQIGAIYNNEKLAGEPGNKFELAPYAKQKAAMNFLSQQVFTTPMWLNEPTAFNNMQENFGAEMNEVFQSVINDLITINRMSRMLWAEQVYATKGQKVYTLNEMFTDLNKNVFTEVYAGKSVDAYRRGLQRIYVDRLIVQGFPDQTLHLLQPMNYHLIQTDVPAMLKGTLLELQSLCKKGMANPAIDKMTRVHLQELELRINAKFAVEKRGK